MSDECISLTGQCADIETVLFLLHLNSLQNVRDTSNRRTVFAWYFEWQTETSPPPPLVQFTLLVAATDHMTCGGLEREKSSGNILFSLLRGGAGSLAENVFGGLS